MVTSLVGRQCWLREARPRGLGRSPQSGLATPGSGLRVAAGKSLNLSLCLRFLAPGKGGSSSVGPVPPSVPGAGLRRGEESPGPRHHGCRRHRLRGRVWASYLTLSSRCGSTTGDKGTGRLVTEGSPPLEAAGQRGGCCRAPRPATPPGADESQPPGGTALRDWQPQGPGGQLSTGRQPLRPLAQDTRGPRSGPPEGAPERGLAPKPTPQGGRHRSGREHRGHPSPVLRGRGGLGTGSTWGPQGRARGGRGRSLTSSSWLCTCWTIRSMATAFPLPGGQGRGVTPAGGWPEPRPPPPRGRLTSGHHDVRQAHGGLDVLVEGRLDELVVLLDDARDVAATLADVTAEPPHKADVGVRVHEDLHVQELRRVGCCTWPASRGPAQAERQAERLGGGGCCEPAPWAWGPGSVRPGSAPHSARGRWALKGLRRGLQGAAGSQGLSLGRGGLWRPCAHRDHPPPGQSTHVSRQPHPKGIVTLANARTPEDKQEP